MGSREMNYEQKYNAALEQAKKELKTCGSLDCDAARQIFRFFPELRESEDERIRKTLIHIVKGACDKYGIKYRGEEISEEKLLAYLEKKKDASKAIEAETLNTRSKQKLNKKDKKIVRALQHALNCADTQNAITKSGIEVSEVATFLQDLVSSYEPAEKQKEQKPVQFKNNELVDIIKGEFEGFRTLLKKKGIDYEPQRSYWEGFARLFDSSAREYVREQKPAEKQDYSGLNDLERAILRGFLAAGVENVPVGIIKETAQECLAQMKPAEWSEEDEEMLNSCICSIEESKENRYAYKETDGDTSYDHEIAWLKSLPERFNLQSKQEQNDYITPHKEFFKFIYDRLINVHKENPNVDYMRSFKERLNNLSFGEKQERNWAKILRYAEKYGKEN